MSSLCDCSLKKLFLLIIKYFFPLLIAIGFRQLLTTFTEYLPFIFFLPSVLWVADKKISKSAQPSKKVAFEELSSLVFIFISYFLPTWLTGLQTTFVQSFDFFQIGLFCFITLIVLPLVVYFGSRTKVQKVIIGVMENQLEGLVVHGRNKKNPRQILKGMASYKAIRIPWLGLDLEGRRLMRNRELAFYRPYLAVGTLELYVTRQERRRAQDNTKIKGTKYIDFFRYQKNKAPWVGPPESSKGRNLKACYRFQVCQESALNLNKFGIRLVEVETGEVFNQNKLVAICYSSRQ